MSSLLSDLSVVYRNALNTFKKSEQYKREIALNISSNVIPFSLRSKYYKLGLYGIEMINSEWSIMDRKYDIYCDLKYLFSNDYIEFISDSTAVSILHANFNLIIISNNDNLSDVMFNYYDYLKFDKELDLTSITLNIIDNINRDDLLNLLPLETNYKLSKSDFSVLLHDVSPIDVMEDRKLLLFLNNIIPKNEIININLLLNHLYSLYYLNKLFTDFIIFDRCFKFYTCGINGPLFIVDAVCFNSPFDISLNHVHKTDFNNFIVDGRRLGESGSLPSKWRLSVIK